MKSLINPFLPLFCQYPPSVPLRFFSNNETDPKELMPLPVVRISTYEFRFTNFVFCFLFLSAHFPPLFIFPYSPSRSSVVPRNEYFLSDLFSTMWYQIPIYELRFTNYVFCFLGKSLRRKQKERVKSRALCTHPTPLSGNSNDLYR
jgi:hypothetical protein